MGTGYEDIDLFDVFQQEEIRKGLEKNLDVTPYTDVRYSWRQMREIRLGIEQHLDISQYADSIYSYWQMREIRLGLKDGLDINCYKSVTLTAKEMSKRRMELKSIRNTSPSSEKWVFINDTDYDILISPDGINAYFSWHCNRAVTGVSELSSILEKNGIVFGINHNALEAIAKEYSIIETDSKRTQNTLIAKGIPAIHGRNGYYEWFFDTKKKRKSKLLADGTIDFDHLDWFEPVKQNQTLAIYHYATTAVDGKTVTGKTIPAKVGKEKSLLTGHGFKMLPDLKTYVATQDGHARLNRNELVVTELTILDGLHPSNEPLTFNSDVYITGDVMGPINIHINGDLAIDGFVEAAQITCTGSMLLKKGINTISNTSAGIVTVHGYVISKSFEHVTLHADGNIYFGTSLHSNLSSYGEIVSYGKEGGIIGGSSYSEKGYCLPNLGDPKGTNTTLLLGTNDNILSQRFALKNEITDIKSKIIQPAEDPISAQNEELESAYQKVAALKKRLERACQSKIIVEQNVYENVQIRYMGKKIPTPLSSQVAFSINNGSLVIEKL